MSELRALVKKLQSASSTEDTISILHLLKKDFKVNEAILRESKAGLAVGKLRTHQAKEVADLAKELVKQWKADVDAAKATANPNSNSKPALPPVNTAVRKQSVASNGPGTPGPVSANGRTMKTDGLRPPFTGDRTRDRCIELVYDALATDSGASSDIILAKSKDIEAAVFTDIGGVTNPYPTKMRSLFVNLKDKNNPSLREAVASGEIAVERFVKMTSQEMASEERKKADEAIKKQNLHNALGAEEPDAETTAFQCSKCKQRRCRYRQAQTRSADEPMTTFVTCVNCNHRWKFS
ncbi:transcription factor S-II, central domain-containing protein [Mycena amicta]|nr:transcription factor S-II, central domain-containing protein [Mycena amicta]